MKNRKKIRKPDRKMPAPTSNERIILTGLLHMEAGESLRRELAFCTAHQNEEAFFLSPEDMTSPDGDKDLAARCGRCKSEGGEAETHWVEDFRTTVFGGYVDMEGGYILTPLFLLENLAEVHGTGPVAKPVAARKAAGS
jgi:hypothetical protein